MDPFKGAATMADPTQVGFRKSMFGEQAKGKNSG